MKAQENLMQAARQWMGRPGDVRFWDLAAMKAAAESDRQLGLEKRVDPREVCKHVYGENDTGRLTLGTGAESYDFTDWALGQLLSRLSAGASKAVMQRVTPTTVVAVLQDLAKSFERHNPTAMLVKRPEVSEDGVTGGLVRAFLSDRYERLWDVELLEQLGSAEQEGWRVPPARPSPGWKGETRFATAADVLQSRHKGLGITEGDTIAPGGLYRSDRNMFAFLVNDDRPMTDPLGEPMYRGFFLANSEVGAASASLSTFWYRAVCGNHIVWDATEVEVFSARHVGTGVHGVRGALEGLLANPHDSRQTLEKRMKELVGYSLGDNKKAVIDNIVSMELATLGERKATAIYELGEQHMTTDGSPMSAWGFVQAITRHSQTLASADARVAMDADAGKLLQLV